MVILNILPTPREHIKCFVCDLNLCVEIWIESDR